MSEKTEIEKIYSLLEEVATNAAAAPQVAPIMPPTKNKITREEARHAQIRAKRDKALKDVAEMLKKISKIEAPDFKKHRIQDPHRSAELPPQNVAVAPVSQPDNPDAHKISRNIPNTTHVNPNFPSTPKVRS